MRFWSWRCLILSGGEDVAYGESAGVFLRFAILRLGPAVALGIAVPHLRKVGLDWGGLVVVHGARTDRSFVTPGAPSGSGGCRPYRRRYASRPNSSSAVAAGRPNRVGAPAHTSAFCVLEARTGACRSGCQSRRCRLSDVHRGRSCAQRKQTKAPVRSSATASAKLRSAPPSDCRIRERRAGAQALRDSSVVCGKGGFLLRSQKV